MNTALSNRKGGKKKLSWGVCVSVKLRTDYSFCLLSKFPRRKRRFLIDWELNLVTALLIHFQD